MTKNIALSRPATSAIAAFLALSTPAAFAQDAPSIPMTPPVAAPVSETAPPAPQSGDSTVASPPAQSTQPAAPAPVIRVPLDIAPAEAPVAEAASATETSPPPAARSEAPARAERRARIAPAPVAAEASPTTPAGPAASDVAEVPAPTVLTEAAPTVDAAPVAAPVSADDSFPWELAGGAALALALGGAGLAFARRRRAVTATDYAETVVPTEFATPTSDAQPWVTPAYTAPPAPVRSSPAFAAAPSGSMGRHEAMAMAGPTPDNPFATLSKRLKRARFFDRQERLAYEQTLQAQKDMTRKPVSAWEIAQREAPNTAQQQEVRRPEPARGRRDLRPGFSRS